MKSLLSLKESKPPPEQNLAGGEPRTQGAARDGGRSSGTLAEEFSSSLLQAATAVRAWAVEIADGLNHLKQGEQQLVTNAERLEGAFSTAASRIETLVTTLGGLRGDTARLADGLRRVQERQEVVEHNLEQVRCLVSSLDRKMERLSGDFVDHQVKEPLCKEFARLASAMRALGRQTDSNPHEESTALADQIESFLQEQGLSLIEPVAGEAFNPHAHQPIQSQVITDCAWHGRIACTFSAGLRRNGRIIQLARVGVFVCKESNTEIQSQ